MTPVNNDLKKAIKAEEHIALGLADVLAGLPSDGEIKRREAETPNDTTTARNQPHKYRCETCKNPDCPFGVEAKYCVRIIPNIMHKVGCASHSSATKAEQRITDVIKELGELTNALENMEPERGSENWCAMQAYKRCIALLRERGE